MKIAVVGMGYVGLSLACLLSQNNTVVAVDIDCKKIDMINNKKSPISDSEIEDFFYSKKLGIYATDNINEAFVNSDYVIISAPTNFDEEKNSFDTSNVEEIIKQAICYDLIIVIKSTVPIGFTEKMIKKYSYDKIIFSPEFLREGKALYDNLYPSRIIVGYDLTNNSLRKYANQFANLLANGANKNAIERLFMKSNEAEAVKLFSNSYLAMRVSFFNEVDTFSLFNNMNTKSIIDGICLDSRIGNFYNNPSFGYGGYCLPKDTKQLLAQFGSIPQKIISAIVQSNEIRKNYIADKIMERKNKTVGIYRLIMKVGSDNIRQSSLIDIINLLLKYEIKVIIYEPIIECESFLGCSVVNDFEKFVNSSEVIIANRFDDKLLEVKDKVFTRDIYQKN